MEATLLGTSDAFGVPAPLCDCKYCKQSDERTRPSVVVSSGETTILLDASPDVRRQLDSVGVTDLDAVYVTHSHFDHSEGLSELVHSVATGFVRNSSEFSHATHGGSIDIVAPPESVQQFQQSRHFTRSPGLKFDSIPSRHSEVRGPLSVTALPVSHGDTQTFGYAVQDSRTGEKLVYAPDMAGWKGVSLGEPDYADADVLVIEGAELVGVELHGSVEAVEGAVEEADAGEVALVNISEHTAQKTTQQLVSEARPYRVVPDFTTLIQSD